MTNMTDINICFEDRDYFIYLQDKELGVRN